MRRLMAVPTSVAMLMFVVGTSAAQPVTPAKTSAGTSVSIGGGTGTTPAAGATTSATAPVTNPVTTPVTTSAAVSTTGAAATPTVQTGVTATATPAANTTPAPAGGTAAGGPTDQVLAGATTNSAVKDEPVDAGTYGVRLRDLEQRINELKEQIFRSKARLSLLAETVLQGVVSGGQARIVHENKMGNSYKLVKVVYALDGAPIFNKADEEGTLGDRDEFDVYNGSIVPGEHTLTVKLEYRGNGYGIFSYLKGYRFKVSSSDTFQAPEGKATTLRVVGYEKGGPTAPLEERPAIRYVERVSTGSEVPAGTAAGAAPAAAPAAPAAAPTTQPAGAGGG